ncbi:hypothetical protein AGMMS50284_6150 [Clostridia bacterium]|nr:hypothetical protein AGMMS50284_6150 [Clostridia bacterium]
MAMHMLKTRTNNISFTLFDINIHDSFSGKRSFAGEFFVSLAGPLTNFIFAGLFVFLFNRFKLDILNLLTVSNIILGIFNSLPIQSLDGGNALFLFLERNFSVNLTNKILAIISFIFLFPMAVTGFFILLRSPYNFTLFFTSMYLICVLLFKSDIQ